MNNYFEILKYFLMSGNLISKKLSESQDFTPNKHKIDNYAQLREKY